jgi:hypothetical protein
MKRVIKFKTTPTAENFIINKLNETQTNLNTPPSAKEVEEWMIEFTKIHLSEAFEQISKKFKNADNIRAIKKTYPLNSVE